MKEYPSEFIDVSQLRTGLFVELELGWMAHPFPTSNFKISSDKQIEVIRSLGLTKVRYVPLKSDPAELETMAAAGAVASSESLATAATSRLRELSEAQEQHRRKDRARLIAMQQRSLVVCERRFGEATRQYKQVLEQLDLAVRPVAARDQCREMIQRVLDEMTSCGETAIRLLSEGMSDRASMHPVNVTVISLLLGKAMKLGQSELLDLGVGAFLHDVGKRELPVRVNWLEEDFSSAEYKLYQEHVAMGLIRTKRMELSEGTEEAIAQHHEMADGSGFPNRLRGDQMTMPAKILALVNRYENLCNPSRLAAAMTPHEALSLIFSQMKVRFDGAVLSAFIRMMGVYPPGSVVQLVDDRYALVVSVNASRPLKPRIVVHEPSVPRHEALILDLELMPETGIRRSLRPSGLPPAAMDYLLPRQRISYFFEKAGEMDFSDSQL